MSNKRLKAIKQQLHDIVGYPTTATDIKAFNQTLDKCKRAYKMTKQMPVDVLKGATA